jgi:hypothetical protein
MPELAKRFHASPFILCAAASFRDGGDTEF